MTYESVLAWSLTRKRLEGERHGEHAVADDGRRLAAPQQGEVPFAEHAEGSCARRDGSGSRELRRRRALGRPDAARARGPGRPACALAVARLRN